jgi:hypothetical protein
MEPEETLDLYLSGLRRAARLSIEQVCDRTKIQPRFVLALEAGAYSEVPSNTHLRAFSLAMAKACGGDEERAAALVRRLLSATAPVAAEGAPRGFDTQAPAPGPAQAPPRGPSPSQASGGSVLATAGGPQRPAVPASAMAAASARLRSLPLGVLLSLLALAGSLSYAAAWSVEHWRQRSVAALLEAQPAAATGRAQAPASPAAAGLPADGTGPAASDARDPAAAGVGAAAAPSELEQASGAAPAATGDLGLTLRARRACWLVLSIDGKRLPTVTMLDGDKLNWTVSQRAVLLAGNVGALRVWWQGDNDGYLGELGQRANAIVFERGKQPRFDKSAALALPKGIPE